MYINTSLPNDRRRILKPETELYDLNDDSTDIFKTSLIEEYCESSSSSNNKVKNTCLAEFTAW